MKKILVLGTSLSKQSINFQLANYAASLVQDCTLEAVPLSAINSPLYNIEDEKAQGFPETIVQWIATIPQYDGIILSTSEHNANVTAAFKNLLDWASRKQIDFLKDKSVLLLSTSPGGYGGQNAQQATEKMLPKFGAQIVAKFALPKFQEHFKDGAIVDEQLLQQLKDAVAQFQNHIQ